MHRSSVGPVLRFTDLPKARRLFERVSLHQTHYGQSSGARAIMSNMRLVVDALDVRSAHFISERCETTIENAGGCVVAISTAFPRRGVVLNGSYLADFAAAPLAASYLLTAPGRPRRMWQRILEEEPLGTSLVRACLLDHASVLHDCLERLWEEPITVTVSERSLEQGAELWRSIARASH